MSREILFRGKDKYSERWYEGFILNKKKDKIGYYNNCLSFSILEIKPETVGQFTGLTDKNGKKIFEGDILQGTIVSSWNKKPIICKVVYKRDRFICEQIIRGVRICDHKVCFAKDIEVIGNIYDNKELLGENK